MNLTEDMIKEFQSWVLGGNTSPTYLIQVLSANSCMLYGTGSPQLFVASMEKLIVAALNTHSLHVLGWMPPLELKRIIEEVKSDKDTDKTLLEQVSNRWLKSVEGYAFQVQKAQTATGKDKGKADRALAEHLTDKDDTAKADFLKRFHTSPMSIDQKFDDSFFEGAKNKTRTQTTRGKDVKLPDKISDFAVRRACKFLMYDSIQQKKMIAYLLDDLDLAKVAYLVAANEIPQSARMTAQENPKAAGKVPVCSTEIREIFRNWDFLQGKVVFFKEFNAVEPPWKGAQYAKDWAAYAGHRAQTILGAPQVAGPDRLKFEEAIAEQKKGSFETAIAAFHAGHPSLYNKKSMVNYANTVPLDGK